MSHGTGRQRSRGEAKEVEFDQQVIRERIIIPDGLENGSWRLEAPIHIQLTVSLNTVKNIPVIFSQNSAFLTAPRLYMARKLGLIGE